MFQYIYKKKLIDRKQNNLTDWILFFIFEGVMLVSLFLVLQSIIDILLHMTLSIKFGLLTLMDDLEAFLNSLIPTQTLLFCRNVELYTMTLSTNHKSLLWNMLYNMLNKNALLQSK